MLTPPFPAVLRATSSYIPTSTPNHSIIFFVEKRAWVYNGDHMSPTPLREPKVHVELFEKGELKRMEALDLPVSPRDMEQWSIGTSLYYL